MKQETIFQHIYSSNPDHLQSNQFDKQHLLLKLLNIYDRVRNKNVLTKKNKKKLVLQT